VKQEEILAAVRARGRRHDPTENVGGARGQVVPTEFLPASARSVASATKTTSWAEKIQRERDAQRAAEKQAESEPEGEDPDTQSEQDEENAGKVAARGATPRTKRTPRAAR
jgi:hypothetical protein